MGPRSIEVLVRGLLEFRLEDASICVFCGAVAGSEQCMLRHIEGGWRLVPDPMRLRPEVLTAGVSGRRDVARAASSSRGSS